LLLALATAASPSIARADGHGHGDRGHHHDQSWHGHGHHGRDRHDDRYVGWYGHRAPVYRSSYPVYRSSYPVYRNSYPAYPVYRNSYPVYGNIAYGPGYYIPAPHWTRGTRYYDPGYGPTYVISDYGAYGLGYPPSGYGWRRDARGDFLLVWLASGVIVDLILHGGY
jgi:Ni/Co efflux regulator RcnB